MQLDGFATIGGSGFSERLFVSDGGNVDLTGPTIFGIEELRGNLFANQFTLTGGADGQFINAQGGDDVILGALGSDTINAGTGKDALSGDDGNDSLLGGDDVDTLLGGNGNDLLNGGAGTDSLSWGAGNDNFRVTLPRGRGVRPCGNGRWRCRHRCPRLSVGKCGRGGQHHVPCPDQC